LSRRLDIGILAWMDVDRLRKSVTAVRQHSTTDWRLLIVDNSPEGSPTRDAALNFVAEDFRITAHFSETNLGYAGGVNEILNRAETPYIAYLDHDAYVQTPGWDEKLCGYLDRFHEIGLIFPGGGPRPIQRPAYTEVMWGVGCCWLYSRMAMLEVGGMDTTIGHQNECDLALRVRMAGWKCAAVPEVQVIHDEVQTRTPASQARIDQGVREFVDKWNKYFNGKLYNYHHPFVTRWDDWPANALYNEEYFLQKLPGLNASPEVVIVDGQKFDLVKVLRPHGFYVGRSI